MNRLLAVARREYLERVRSKAFLISTLLGPILMGGMMVLPGLVTAKQRGKALRVAVVDASGAVAARVEQALSGLTADGAPRFSVVRAPAGAHEQARAALRADVLAGRIDGYLYLPADALERSTAEYYGKSVSNFIDQGEMNRAVSGVLVEQRLVREGLEPGRIQDVIRPLQLKTLRVSASGEREDRMAPFAALILMMMVYISVLLWGQAVLTGVIEEKSNRVVEVVISSVRPTVLLGGKLLGIGAAGLTQMTVWAAVTAVLGVYGAVLTGRGGWSGPEPAVLAWMVVFFLLGFFLYAAIYAAIGSAVNTVQEAQSLAFPAMVPVVLSVMLFGPVLQRPDSTFSVVVSLIPFFTPLLMFLRIAALTPPAWQIALSLLLTGLTIAGVTWVAARVYRVGILMYGKRPTLPEILRWVRTA